MSQFVQVPDSSSEEEANTKLTLTTNPFEEAEIESQQEDNNQITG